MKKKIKYIRYRLLRLPKQHKILKSSLVEVFPPGSDQGSSRNGPGLSGRFTCFSSTSRPHSPVLQSRIAKAKLLLCGSNLMDSIPHVRDKAHRLKLVFPVEHFHLGSFLNLGYPSSACAFLDFAPLSPI